MRVLALGLVDGSREADVGGAFRFFLFFSFFVVVVFSQGCAGRGRPRSGALFKSCKTVDGHNGGIVNVC